MSFQDLRDERSTATSRGLYDPTQEHDSCGTGFIVNIKGKKSHGLVQQALEMVTNLLHRGACGCEVNTGDGAGILIQLPHQFFQSEADRVNIILPEPGAYGVGMVFLPRDPDERNRIQDLFAHIIIEEGQHILGWRDVPTDDSHLGATARSEEPVIRQVFIGRSDALTHDIDAHACFERKLYIIRKRVDRAVCEALSLDEKHLFYVASLSSNTIVYKGMLIADQLEQMFPDLGDPLVESALALVHQRFSTNTFPSWPLAHPFRYVAHNGEINTLRGNTNWMRAREALCQSELFSADLQKLFPIIQEGQSDTETFDNVLEFLVLTGRPIAHAILMMIPEPWKNHKSMDSARKAFYEYHSTLMEPWDGPASITFTDGKVIGAVLDRNGLRPSRYYITTEDIVIMASEVGVLDIPPEKILAKGRLQPGRIFLVDTIEGRIINDEEIKTGLASERPYGDWVSTELVHLKDLPAPPYTPPTSPTTLRRQQRAFGYTEEDLRLLVGPMARTGAAPLGSMGNDAALAILSDRPRLLYDYFKQLFAQVTNPPLDAIREKLITDMSSTLGSECNLLAPDRQSCHLLKIDDPVLDNKQLATLRHVTDPAFQSKTLPMLFRTTDGAIGLERAMAELCRSASAAVASGYTLLVISDRGLDSENAPIPSLLATAGVHHHLVREGIRTKCSLIIESGEVREVHHMALLVGYGAAAINPYLAFEIIDDLIRQREVQKRDVAEGIRRYISACTKGVLKVMSKMGISTLQSYRGAQTFEAVGLDEEFIKKYFTWTASRIGGIGIETIADEVTRRHARAFPQRGRDDAGLDSGGEYQWRRDGEYHLFNPETVFKLQHATRSGQLEVYREYAEQVNNQSRQLATLRGLLGFKSMRPAIPLTEVEPVESIFKRFATGAMSYGSISAEAHETMAIAMNRIGGKSNTGEGGEDPSRFTPEPNGDLKRSAVKQVASGRFGVTSDYLVNADDIQIKMAQGAKPGEGGQLPGTKVYPWIAKIRYSTPGVGLISPPPHHDIYSIEDLAQLIYDLKNANPMARIHVKLVAEFGVGTIAAGVAKAHADVVLISGHDGGTGAAPLTSIKHAGVPWELGLAETQQVLVLNQLRDRIVVQVDGQMKTGRDVVIAALLGAEEYGFATAPLIVSGCIMMRVCHLDTCPVGIATQNPQLREHFQGKPEFVENFFHFVADEVREIMAGLGFRTMDEMIGRSDELEITEAMNHWKAKGLDLSSILYQPNVSPGVGRRCTTNQDHGLDKALDNELIQQADEALDNRTPIDLKFPIRNVHRTVGTMLGYEVTKRYGGAGLPDDTIRIMFEGTAGQSFGAFVPRGISMTIVGDANDYFGKGLSGGKLTIYPSDRSTFVAEDNIIIGNVALYGATSGEVFIRGVAGERFCVRNSGANAVVEGIGDHGCEYMTGGRVVILGRVGRNFAAGMSGGIAYVLDQEGDFRQHCNPSMVDLDPLDTDDVTFIRNIVTRHVELTKSRRGQWVLNQWTSLVEEHNRGFIKVMPRDYKRVLQAEASDQVEEVECEHTELVNQAQGRSRIV
jgi:glutamate synthase (NADPH/NADH) large chain